MWSREKHQDLNFADDIVLVDTDDTMNNATINIKCEAAKVGSRISQKKMEIMIVEKGVSIDGAYVVDSEEYGMLSEFVYLGSTIGADGQLHKVVQERIGKASGAFLRLAISGKIWSYT